MLPLSGASVEGECGRREGAGLQQGCEEGVEGGVELVHTPPGYC